MPKTATAAKEDSALNMNTVTVVATMRDIMELRFASEAPPELGLQVRKSDDSEGLPTLEASIRTHGVIVPLVIKEHKGHAYVIAGNRRLKMVRKIYAEGSSVNPVFVPTVNADDYAGDTREIALATNISLPPHPVDRYEVISGLIGDGLMSPSDAQARFGMTYQQFNQVMKLGALSPMIRDKWRNKEIDAKTAQTFTLSNNPAEQEKIFLKLERSATQWRGRIDEGEVRRQLIPASQAELRKLIVFVGTEALEEAGLIKQKNWFDDEHHILTDAKGVKTLAKTKLQKECEKLLADGWSWAVLEEEIGNDRYQYGILDTPSKKGFTPEQKAKSGCFVLISHDGELKIEEGRVKPSERKKVEAAERPKKTAAQKAKTAESGGLTNALAQRLSEQLQRAGAEALKTNHTVATAAVIAAISSGGHVLDISEHTTPRKAELFAKVFAGALKATPEQREAMLAQIASQALSIITFNGAGKQPIDDEGISMMFGHMDATRVRGTIAMEFDAKDYFSSIGMATIVGAVRASMGDEHAAKVAKMKKADAAKFAAANVKGWLPRELRTPHYTGPTETKAAKKQKKPKPVKSTPQPLSKTINRGRPKKKARK